MTHELREGLAKENGDEPAFAMPPVYSVDLGMLLSHGNLGLTKRELFAMAAMQGIVSQEDSRYWTPETGKTPEEWRADALRADAEQAVRMADALLAELENGNG